MLIEVIHPLLYDLIGMWMEVLELFKILMISDADSCKKDSFVTVVIGIICGIKRSVLLIILLFVDET